MTIMSASIAETVDLTQRGQYNVARYTLANVNTPVGRYQLENNTVSPAEDSLNDGCFANIEEVETYGLYCAYSHTHFYGALNFGSLTTVHPLSLTKAFEYTDVTYASFGLVEIPGASEETKSPLYEVLSHCYNLETIDFQNLETVGENGLNSVCWYCTALKYAAFDRLHDIGKNGLRNMFADCSSLKTVVFPALTSTSVIDSDALYNMLQNNDNTVQLVFPTALQSTIENLNGYPNFGAQSQPIFKYADMVQLPCDFSNLPSGYRVFHGEIEITNETRHWFYAAETNYMHIIGPNSVAHQQFTVESGTTEYAPDISGVTYLPIEIYSTIDNIDFTVEYSYLKLYLELDKTTPPTTTSSGYYIGKIYSTASNTSFYIDGDPEGYYVQGAYVAADSSPCLVQVYPALKYVFTPNNFINEGTYSDSSYASRFSVDSENRLVLHSDSRTTEQYSVGLQCPQPTLQPGQTVDRVIISTDTDKVVVSSENNWDFGFVGIGSYVIAISAADLKNGTIPSGFGKYLFRGSGEQSSIIYNTNFNVSDGYWLIIGWGQDDGGGSGTNSLYVPEIRLTYILSSN